MRVAEIKTKILNLYILLEINFFYENLCNVIFIVLMFILSFYHDQGWFFWENQILP